MRFLRTLKSKYKELKFDKPRQNLTLHIVVLSLSLYYILLLRHANSNDIATTATPLSRHVSRHLSRHCHALCHDICHNICHFKAITTPNYDPAYRFH
jgi:hypothetical protein